MPAEPAFRAAIGLAHRDYNSLKAAYSVRWRWWYSAISDWMIANPGGSMDECAKIIGRHPNTVRLVQSTDMFRDFHAQRLEEFRRTHDFALAHKLTVVAEKSLDLTLDVMKKKGDQVPLATLVEITSSSLEKLGYGAKPTTPSVVVNNNQQVVVPVSANELLEAREALRRAEEKRIAPQPQPPTIEAQVEAPEGSLDVS